MRFGCVHPSFRSLAGMLALALVAVSGPACLALGPAASLAGEPAAHTEQGRHAHHGHEAVEHDPSHPQLKHHCQCPAHRGLAPSGSHAGLPAFLMPAETGAVFHATSLALAAGEEVAPDGTEPEPDPPVPLALS